MLTIYGKMNCQQCLMAKMECDMKGIPYEYKLLGTDFEMEFVTSNYPKHREFPLILNGNDYIGGYKDLKSFQTTETI